MNLKEIIRIFGQKIKLVQSIVKIPENEIWLSDNNENIIHKIVNLGDWQVIASGEVKNIIYQTGQVIISFNKLPEKLTAGNIICGKDIEIAVRIKE
jgi:hypothetical protein